MPICIAGMHRSGTSMVAMLLNLGGIYLGPETDLMPPSPDNADGFWEHRRFVELNDAILEELGAGWDCPPDPAVWPATDRLDRCFVRGALLIQAFEEHEPWGWKDPRNSLTLPFWTTLLPALKVIICVRNPLEVALSLRRRNYFSYPQSLTLWARYNELLLEHTVAAERLVTHYDKYFDDPAGELKRILQFLGVPASAGRVEQAVVAAKTELRHHRLTTADLMDAGVSREVLGIYGRLCIDAEWPLQDTKKRSGSLGTTTTRPSRTNGSGTAGQAESLEPCDQARLLIVGDRTERAIEGSEPVGRVQGAILEAEMLRREHHTLEVAHLELQRHVEREIVTRDADGRRIQAALEHQRGEYDASVRELQRSVQEESTRASQLSAEIVAREAGARELEGRIERQAIAFRDLQATLDEGSLRVRQLEEQMSTHEATARNLQSQIDAHLETAANLGVEITRRDESLRELQCVVDDRTALAQRSAEEIGLQAEEIGRLQAQVAERVSEVQSLAVDLAAREQVIQALQEAVEDRTTSAQRSADELAVRNAAARELQEEVSRQAIEIAGLSDQIKHRDSTLAGLGTMLDERADVVRRQTDLDARDAKLRDFQVERQQKAASHVRLTEQLTRSERAVRELQSAPDERSAWMSRLAEDASARDAHVRELHTQLAARSAWAFRMVEGLMLQGSQTVATSGAPLEAAPVMAGHLAALANPERFQEALREQGAQLVSTRDQLTSVEIELNGARQAAARFEMELHEARRVRHRLEENAKREYEHLKQRLLESMERVIPRRSTVLMISRGDDGLVGVNGRKVWHFPQNEKAVWAGHYPADSAAAIAHLEALRAKGATYLVLPATSRWWLAHYHELRTHLGRYRIVFDREDTGMIVDVTEPAWQGRLRTAIAAFEERLGREPALLDWDSGLDLAAVFPAYAVFSPPAPSSALPYLDGSVDIAVCPSRSALVAEARRVASGMVVTVSRPRTNGRGTEAKSEGRIRVGIEAITQAAAPKAVRRGRSSSAVVRRTLVPTPRVEKKSTRGRR